MTARASIIVLSWNGEKFLDACLRAVLAQTDETMEVFVVDNASTDGSAAIARSFAPRVRLIRNEINLGFAGGNNVGLKAASGEVVILLNQDTMVQPGWLAAILETFADPSIGIVGCKALYPDGKTIQHAGARVKPGTAFTEHIGLGEVDEGQYDQLADMDYVTGAAFAIHRRVLEQLGGLDEGYFPAFYEEVDYCYCARRAGFRIVYQPRAVFHHYETTSLPVGSFTTQTIWHRNRIRFALRHFEKRGLEEFVQAERVAIRDTQDAHDMMARARAYFDAMLIWPKVATDRKAIRYLGASLLSTNQWLVMEALQDLHHQMLEHLQAPLGDVQLQLAQRTSVDEGNFSRVQELLSEIERQVQFHEQSIPVSPMPLFGPIITWVRGYWLASMVKPYFIPILSHIFHVLQEMTRQLQAQADVIKRQAEALQWQTVISERYSEIQKGNDEALAEALRETLSYWMPPDQERVEKHDE